jgi:hypothetical protein
MDLPAALALRGGTTVCYAALLMFSAPMEPGSS